MLCLTCNHECRLFLPVGEEDGKQPYKCYVDCKNCGKYPIESPTTEQLIAAFKNSAAEFYELLVRVREASSKRFAYIYTSLQIDNEMYLQDEFELLITVMMDLTSEAANFTSQVEISQTGMMLSGMSEKMRGMVQDQLVLVRAGEIFSKISPTELCFADFM